MDAANIIQAIAINVVPLLLAIILHEVSHGYVAERLGDPTARMLGRLTLNPLPHIDPIGTVLVPLMLIATGSNVLFGWAKPVPISPVNFKNPEKGMAISAAAGPITNSVLAVISAVLLRVVLIFRGTGPGQSLSPVLLPLVLMLDAFINWNVLLAAFNLLPILPLDGGRILKGFLPPKLSYSFGRTEPYGMFILIFLLFTGIAWSFIGPIRAFMFYILSLISGVRLI